MMRVSATARCATSGSPSVRVRNACAWVVWASLFLVPAQPAAPQAIDRPADDRVQPPAFETPVSPEPILPPIPIPEQPRERFSVGPGIYIENYRIVGSTVFDKKELALIVAPWTGREIRSEDLVAVRNAITNLYLAAGYVNSGAVIDDQDFLGQTIVVRIIEGALQEIVVEGNRYFRDRYFQSRIRGAAQVPLNLHEVERELQILQQDPRIERIAARIVPGAELGQAVLYLEVAGARPLDVALRTTNYEPVSIGPYAGQFEGTYHNLVGWGDAIQGTVTISEGLNRYRGIYDLPFTRWDTTLVLDGRYTKADVVEDPFDALNFESKFQSYQIGIRQPLFQTPRNLIELGVIFDWRRSKTEQDGFGFSFPGSGAKNGEVTASVIRVALDWLYRDQRRVMAARSQFNFGVDVLDATINSGNTPDGEFFSWLLQLQIAQRFAFLGVDMEAVVRSDLQLSDSPLLSMEQTAVGGFATVRGYRENQYVRDQAVIGSAELRVPLWRDPDWLGAIDLAPFVDFGYTWDHADRIGDRDKTLASVGLGLRWSLSNFMSARIYWGQNLTSVPTSGDLQDKGVQFMISVHLP